MPKHKPLSICNRPKPYRLKRFRLLHCLLHRLLHCLSLGLLHCPSPHYPCMSQVKGRSVAGALKLRRKSPPFVSQVLIFSLTCDRYQPSVHSSVAGRPNFEDPRRYFDPPATQNVTSLLFRFRRTYTSCRVETDRTKVHKKGRCPPAPAPYSLILIHPPQLLPHLQ